MKNYLLSLLLPLLLVLSACSTDDEEQEHHYSPRAKLMYEFVKDHLQPGLSKERIIALLGKPQSQYDTTFIYLIQEGLIDPTMLVINFDKNGTALKFTVQQG